MNNIIEKSQSNITFDARIRLCDKSVLNLPHNSHLLRANSPMDFFYKESKTKSKLDIVMRDIKAFIRRHQNKESNSEFVEKALKKNFKWINDLSGILNKVYLLKNIVNLYKSLQIVKNVDKSSTKYIDTWAIFGNNTKEKFIDINIEDCRIEDFAKLNEPAIFIMNHDNPNRDKFIYPIINSFLNYSYATLGKQTNCPRPYIIVSKNVTRNAGNDLMRKIYEKMGLVPIDASLTDRNFCENILPMKDLLLKFIDNKANIFVFPEGNNSIYKDKTLQEKFQLGVPKMIKRILDKKSSLNVIPIGITYGEEKNNMGNIYLGSIIKIEKQDKKLQVVSENTFIPLGEINDKKTLQTMAETLASKLEYCVNLSRSINK